MSSVTPCNWDCAVCSAHGYSLETKEIHFNGLVHRYLNDEWTDFEKAKHENAPKPHDWLDVDGVALEQYELIPITCFYCGERCFSILERVEHEKACRLTFLMRNPSSSFQHRPDVYDIAVMEGHYPKFGIDALDILDLAREVEEAEKPKVLVYIPEMEYIPYLPQV